MTVDVTALNETVSCTVLANGSAIPDTYELLLVDTSHEINRIPFATLVLRDGNIAEQEFAISNAGIFGLGENIEISARYEGHSSAEESLFKGVVVKHAVEAGPRGTQLTITLKSKAIQMTRGVKNTIYRKKTDSNILKTMVNASGVSVGKIDVTKAEHQEMVQYGATDWDFALTRAEANGLVVAIIDEKFNARVPEVRGKPVSDYHFGLSDIFSFEIEADGEQQIESLQSASWDIKTQKMTKETKAADVSTQLGNWQSGKIARSLGNRDLSVSHSVPLEPQEIKAWTDGVLSHSRLALVRGTLVAAANGKLKLLDVISLEGIGDRFNGTTLVTGVRHSLDANGWQTSVQFGFPAETFTQQHNIHAPAASSLLPAIHGLLIGLAGAFKKDPEGEFRIQVKLPQMPPDSNLIWARVLMPDAGKERGVVRLPQPDDEVIVGFLNNDPRHAVVLGSLFSSANKPPADLTDAWNEKYELSGFATRSGLKVTLNDQDKPSYAIETPANNKLFFDDDKQAITLSDQHGNKVVLDDKGITLESAKDMRLKSSGKLELEARSDITIKGSEVEIA